VNDEPEHTYSAREIVLEFFPATSERLIPRTSRYRLVREGDGALIIFEREGGERLRLLPVEAAGHFATRLCCDLCQWTAARQYLGLYRAEVPGSDGRRFRYVTACRDTDACEARRLDDASLLTLLAASR